MTKAGLNFGTFTCAKCGKTVPKSRSDEDALAEARANFGDAAFGDPICGECFKEFRVWMAENYPGVINN